MGKYFGTDGFRGEANKDLTFEHAVKIGRFLGWYYGARLNKKAKVVIGKDTRRRGRLYHARDHHPLRFLHNAGGRF